MDGEENINVQRTEAMISSSSPATNPSELPTDDALVHIPELAELTTDRERRFVYLIALGNKLPEEAARLSGYAERDSYQHTANDLIKKPKILTALDKLCKGKLPIYKLLSYFEQILENPSVPYYDKKGNFTGYVKDENLRFRALCEISKIRGLYAEEKKESKPLVTEEELVQRIRKAAKIINCDPIN